MGDNRTIGRIDAQLERGLAALIRAGSMTRKSVAQDYYSADGKIRMPADIGRRLKARRLAVNGFGLDIIATEKGKRLVGNQDDSDIDACELIYPKQDSEH